jgi:hypothetical protein
VVTVVLVARGLARLDSAWVQLRCQAGHRQREGALNRVVVVSATLGLAAFTVWYYLLSNAFVLPPAREYGNVGRNTLRGPDLKLVDLSVFKNTMVGKQNIQFRLEIFNLFNRANFATPNSAALFNPDGTRIPAATQITHTATTSRQVQLGLKFVF